jgi:pimeloyl-ACP methyl ester carboxylesterase
VNWQKGLSDSYARVLELAEAANDKETVAALHSIGPPPWKTLFPQWRTYRKAEQLYQDKIARQPGATMTIAAAYAGKDEQQRYSEAEDFSMFHFWTGRQPKSQSDFAALPMTGPLTKVDLPALGMEFKIPIYIVQGDADLTAPLALAKAYYEGIKAPAKGFYAVPGVGHEPAAPMRALTRKILVEQVKPLAK